MAGGPGFPGPYDVYVPNHEASGGLLVGFSRNVKDFALNQYCELFPSKTMLGLYASYTSRNAARVVSPTDAESDWADGDPCPPGLNNLESFQYLAYRTKRKAYTFTLGEMTVEQMSFDLLMTNSKDMAQKCMTVRTMLTHAALGAASWGANSASAATILGSGQNWTNGSVGFPIATEAGAHIKQSLQYGTIQIHLSTIGVVKEDKLCLVINPRTAQAMARSTEIQDYLKQSPFALAQVRQDVPNQNGKWGLPDTLYGYKVVVEDAVRVSSNKGATTDAINYVMADGIAYLVSRPDKLVGLAGSRSYSTIQIFFYKDEMTMETLYDRNNKRYMGRVITNYVPIVATTFSGFQFTGVLG